ncbi:hypothetical protein C0Q70_15805 [Pomacea canaliculata]|uniref:Uncharacterized protein n=1 Tax=Pomacea canaliculata TaxID=400727 RepID=A0A2T7NVW1_POMCA|nr:hypothetical protein C0Q70_15805 [Pomacea canaliculata]
MMEHLAPCVFLSTMSSKTILRSLRSCGYLGQNTRSTTTRLTTLNPSCAVCRAARAATIMVPATSSCYTGWTLEYTGILMAGLYAHKVVTKFICADSALEWLAGPGHSKEIGKMLYSVLSSCRLCPPYIEGEVLSCVVCSK